MLKSILALFLAMLLLASFAWSQSVTPKKGSGHKTNLDLPFDAVGADSEKEEAPELIIFYGEAYEASNVVFCLDESLTMNNSGRFDIERREVRRAISELNPDAEFGVLFYGGQVTSFRRQLIKASPTNKRAAMAFITSRVTNLGTCLGNSVEQALQMLNRSDSRFQAVILVSDGTPTRCPFARLNGCQEKQVVCNEALAQISTANVRRMPVHCILVGNASRCAGLPTQFMRAVSGLSGGSFRHVPQ